MAAECCLALIQLAHVETATAFLLMTYLAMGHGIT
ncbi:MAG: hypothetical protein ETSY1_43195 [Candidatus Entotheonella factor]|uniref:Uncharacterized protein n=1 Tax=Entotheonella factor TaxID=1429438 RepID=W4L359_ENTF1|nr:MAG: hypothetical protein ETSY1_43195 [Candidatus Entotheonella factor]